MSMHLVLKPRMSEKAYELSKQAVYVIAVPDSANKHTVSAAVESQFKVTVTSVNIANVTGKVKRTVRKGGRAIAGRSTDTKKAYITLKKGDSIPVFAAIEEAEVKSEKLEKAATKAAKRESK